MLTVSEVLEEWSVTDHSLNWGNSLFISSATAGLLGQLAHTHSVTLKRTILHNKTARMTFTVQHAYRLESQGDLISCLSQNNSTLNLNYTLSEWKFTAKPKYVLDNQIPHVGP